MRLNISKFQWVSRLLMGLLMMLITLNSLQPKTVLAQGPSPFFPYQPPQPFVQPQPQFVPPHILPQAMSPHQVARELTQAGAVWDAAKSRPPITDTPLGDPFQIANQEVIQLMINNHRQKLELDSIQRQANQSLLQLQRQSLPNVSQHYYQHRYQQQSPFLQKTQFYQPPIQPAYINLPPIVVNP